MQFTQYSLPFDKDALEPHMSKDTVTYHYDRHHAGYVRKLNELCENTPYADLSLEETIKRSRTEGDIDILRNAAQSWNHDFYWQGLSPNGGEPDGRVKEAIEQGYNSYDEFKAAFREAATSLLGSGWVWLLIDRGEIRIASGPNADTPVGTDLTPLLVLDVWEHAYYLDYQNERNTFTDRFLENMVNWNFVAANLESAELKRAA